MLSEYRSGERTGRTMRLGYFGEARRQKGFDFLVEAIEILAKSNHGSGFERHAWP